MTTLQALEARLQALQVEWVEELHRLREERGYHLEGRKIRIKAAIRKLHGKKRARILRYLWRARLSALVTGPVIWGALLPAMLLDLYISLYQLVCFPAYGIPKVRRSDYLIMDRRHLPYLNGIERLNCFYCSYFNGLVVYAQEIAARTEQHWCPIKHARAPRALHSRYQRFFEFGDAEAFRGGFEAVRRDYSDLPRPLPHPPVPAGPRDHPP